MPRSNNDQVPCHYVRQGTWPYAVLDDDAPVSAHRCQELAQNLAHVMASVGHTLRPLARISGVAHSTIARLLQGQVLPDVGTLARLEDALGVPLWPTLHDSARSAPSPERGQAATTGIRAESLVGLPAGSLQRLPDAEYIAFLNALGNAFSALIKDRETAGAPSRSTRPVPPG